MLDDIWKNVKSAADSVNYGIKVATSLPSLCVIAGIHLQNDFEEAGCFHPLEAACQDNQYRSLRMDHRQSNILPDIGDSLIRSLGGKLARAFAKHDHLQVDFQCEKCGQQLPVVIEFTKKTGSVMRPGVYGRIIATVQSADINLTYEQVKDIYERHQRFSSWFFRTFNDADYANKMFHKIRLENERRSR